MVDFFRRWLRVLWPDRRSIFRYRAAGERRYADPIQIDQALTRHGGQEWMRLLALVDSLRRPVTPAIAAAKSLTGDVEEGAKLHREQFNAALADLVGIVRKSFGLPGLDPETGKGVTDAEAVGVLVDYLEFAEQLVEDVRPLS